MQIKGEEGYKFFAVYTYIIFALMQIQEISCSPNSKVYTYIIFALMQIILANFQSVHIYNFCSNAN